MSDASSLEEQAVSIRAAMPSSFNEVFIAVIKLRPRFTTFVVMIFATTTDCVLSSRNASYVLPRVYGLFVWI